MLRLKGIAQQKGRVIDAIDRIHSIVEPLSSSGSLDRLPWYQSWEQRFQEYDTRLGKYWTQQVVWRAQYCTARELQLATYKPSVTDFLTALLTGVI